jgi:hypothetical protein
MKVPTPSLASSLVLRSATIITQNHTVFPTPVSNEGANAELGIKLGFAVSHQYNRPEHTHAANTTYDFIFVEFFQFCFEVFS